MKIKHVPIKNVDMEDSEKKKNKKTPKYVRGQVRMASFLPKYLHIATNEQW